MKVYVLTKVKIYGNEDHAVWSGAFKTRKEAENAMRDEMLSDCDCAFDTEDEDCPDFDEMIESALEEENEEHDAYIDQHDASIDLGDCMAHYDIFESTI